MDFASLCSCGNFHDPERSGWIWMDSPKKSLTIATLCAPPPRIRPGSEGEPTEGRSRPVPVDFAPLSWSAQAIAAAERIGIGKAKPQAGRTRPKRQRLIATEGDSRHHDSDGDSRKATGKAATEPDSTTARQPPAGPTAGRRMRTRRQRKAGQQQRPCIAARRQARMAGGFAADRTRPGERPARPRTMPNRLA